MRYFYSFTFAILNSLVIFQAV